MKYLTRLQKTKNLLLAKRAIPSIPAHVTVVSAAAPVYHALPPSPLNYPAAPSAHVHNTFPPPHHAIDTIVSYEMLLTNVNGSLTSLSAFRGFRNFITAKAKEIGITGVIQRYHHRDVYLKFEGTPEEVDLFRKFLRECRNQGMIEDFRNVARYSDDSRFYDSFKILTDCPRTEEEGGKVIRGEFSDPDHDKLTVYSADRPTLNYPSEKDLSK